MTENSAPEVPVFPPEEDTLHLTRASKAMTRILGEWVAGPAGDIHIAMIWGLGWMDGDASEWVTVMAGGIPVFVFSREQWLDDSRFGFYLDEAEGESRSDLQVSAAVMWQATGQWSHDEYETWVTGASAEAVPWASYAEGIQHGMSHAALMDLGARLAGWDKEPPDSS
jgi:hypothetical protein